MAQSIKYRSNFTLQVSLFFNFPFLSTCGDSILEFNSSLWNKYARGSEFLPLRAVTYAMENHVYHIINSQLDTTNESQEVSPFPAGDHKAHINRRAQRHSKRKTVKNIKDPKKKYHLGTVNKIFN